MEQGRSIKWTVIRTLIFAVIWFISFVAGFLYVYHVDDIGAAYFYLYRWQLLALIPAYFVLDKKYSHSDFFAGRVWCLVAIAWLSSLILFLPIGFVLLMVLILFTT